MVEDKDKDMNQKKEVGVELKKEILWLAKTVAIAFGLTVFLNSTMLVNARVPSQSMENTIEPGDRFLGTRLAYSDGDPERFDVIVFKYPDDESVTYVKRIIGLPGEVVNIVEGKVYINDSQEPLEEDFIAEPMIGSYGPYEVPEDCYFVLGDNRNNSNDSRFWSNTFVSRSQIVGKAVVCYWPPAHVGLIQ